MFGDAFLLPGLLLVGTALVGGITLAVLSLHNQADEQEHRGSASQLVPANHAG
jgi:hypothetical protein